MAKPRTAPTRIAKRVLTRRPPAEVFAFFDRPSNLKRVIPDSLAVSLERHPEDLRPGAIFAYRLKSWPLDLSWEVVVSEYSPPESFTHVKSTGYFPRWSQRHTIVATETGTEIRIDLDYEVPSGLYANLSNTYVIRGAMEELLREQARAIGEALEQGD